MLLPVRRWQTPKISGDQPSGFYIPALARGVTITFLVRTASVSGLPDSSGASGFMLGLRGRSNRPPLTGRHHLTIVKHT